MKRFLLTYNPIFFIGFLICLLLFQETNAQEYNDQKSIRLDSLNEILSNPNSHDTSVASAYVGISEILYVTDLDTLQYLSEKAIKLCDDALENNPNKAIRNSLLKYQSGALNNLGYMYKRHGDIAKAITIYEQALQIQRETNDIEGEVSSIHNLAIALKQLGNISEALEYYYQALKINEENDFKEKIAISLNSIAIVFEDQKDYAKALEFLLRSLQIREEIGDPYMIANCLNSIGYNYGEQGDTANAFSYFNHSLAIKKEYGFKVGEVTTLVNIGYFYIINGENERALPYIEEALAIHEELDYKKGMSNALISISEVKFALNKVEEAERYAKRSLELAQEVGLPDETREASELLYKIYEKQKLGMKALLMYDLNILMNDSINNVGLLKDRAQQEAKYIYEKQKIITDAEREKDIALEKKEKEKQRLIALVSGGIMILVVIFLYFVFTRLKLTRKQKGLIEKQKVEVEGQRDIIEVAHKEITDSIAYAKRIQSAILPPPRIVKEYLKDSFVIYRPKDVVAGDFYWMRHVGDKTFFAAADCTGHGVPGAMVSMVCNNALNRSVREYGIEDPGEILNKSRGIVVREFEKSEEDVKDGMDIALCSLEGLKLEYAGAYNPLWLIREGELIEYKANRCPIGRSDNPQPYKTHEIDLKKKDVFYVFTDGYVDQFGGANGKKFKSLQFKKLLIDIAEKPMAEQEILINKAFDNWKGNLEQVDDVCIIGVRV